MLDADELRWVDGVLQGGVRHLFVGTSLPFLLPPGLHDFEAMDEVMAQGAYGRTVARAAEKLRRSIDLEHWAAFNEGFDEVFDLVVEVARGERGPAPQTVTFLSGRRAQLLPRRGRRPDPPRCAVAGGAGRVLADPQPDAAGGAVVMSLFARSLVRPMRFIASKSPHVPDPAYPWTVTDGPWFDNNIALVTWERTSSRSTGSPGSSRATTAHPRLERVYAARLDPLPATVRVGSGSVQG